MNRFETEFLTALEEQLITCYTDAYGAAAWTEKTDAEKAETLHALLASFIGACWKHTPPHHSPAPADR